MNNFKFSMQRLFRSCSAQFPSGNLRFNISPVLCSSSLRNSQAGEQRRYLNLHEFQSKKLLRDFGLNVQKGEVAYTALEALDVASRLKEEGADELILKCQVRAGGRGKGKLTSGLQGGVKVCSRAEEVYEYAKKMIGYNLVTHQTSLEGEYVGKVLVHEGVTIARELYVAILLDRSMNGPAIVASSMGGVDIEEVAKTQPDAISVTPINIFDGITAENISRVCRSLGYGPDANSPQQLEVKSQLTNQLNRLYQLLLQCDATQVEINPLAVTSKPADSVVCVDAKIQFDDAASFRQKHIFALEEQNHKDPREAAAELAGLNFVALDGNIGCLVNGAGLAMATMDIVKLHGGNPANFLDVGGGATVEQVTEAFKILQADDQVKAIFVNIFGGIMRCDIIATGIVEAAKLVDLSLPLVIRLCGNRVEEGREILEKSGVNCIVMADLEKAAIAACSFANPK